VSTARTYSIEGKDEAWVAEGALTVAAEALEREIGLIEPALLDLGASKYKTGYDAKDDVVRLVKTAIERILPAEIQRGITAVECRPDFGSLFPFALDGYIDVILGGSTLCFKDLKTARDSREPDVWGKVQLRLYTLPWFIEGQAVELQIDTITKATKTDVFHTAVEADASAYEAVRKWVLSTAGQISDAMRSGDFPASPSWMCKYRHELSAA
jgi:hypothetical protein